MLFFKRGISFVTILTLTGCLTGSGKKDDSTSTTSSCNDSSCIQNVCPSYKQAELPPTNQKNTICPVVGTCAIPNMPVTSQLTNGIPSGNIACGPTAASMIADAVVANVSSKENMTGWMKQYSQITSASAYCSNLSCQRVVMIADKLIEPAVWESGGAREVFASEIKAFFSERTSELGVGVVSFASDVYPENIEKCKFITGEQAITNQHAASYNVLYREYPQIKKSASTYQGAPLYEISFGQAVIGHYIAMDGFSIDKSDAMFKFHCPIYGVKWYRMVQAKLNEPYCVKFDTAKNECIAYHKITQAPAGFNTNASAVTFLLESDGEDADKTGYNYKVVAFVSGLIP